MTTKLTNLFCVAVTAIACGCSGIKPKRMVPPVAGSSLNTGKSVRVMEVTGGRKSVFGGADYINNEQFQKAVVLTLQKSGRFSEVRTDQGDLDFYAAIRAQDQKVSRGLQYTGTMVVSYKLTDHAGNVLWSASYDSEFSSVAFSGATRTVRAREGAARENLALLMQGLREEWPKHEGAAALR